MKHAYLIMAHNEWEVLRTLISLLDDERNDIYLHIDKKVKEIPLFATSYARLYLVQKRVRVFWGDVSQVEAEYALFELATSTGVDYSHYHLISGTHLPLKTQDYIHRYFESLDGISVVSSMPTNEAEIQFKLGYRHLFVKGLYAKNYLRRSFSNFAWRLCLYAQKKGVGGRKLPPHVCQKIATWKSLTKDLVMRAIEKREEVLNTLSRSFCGDEYWLFLVEAANQTPLRIKNENHWLYVRFPPGSPNPAVVTASQVPQLLESPYLFARKFSIKELEAIKAIQRGLPVNVRSG